MRLAAALCLSLLGMCAWAQSLIPGVTQAVKTVVDQAKPQYPPRPESQQPNAAPPGLRNNPLPGPQPDVGFEFKLVRAGATMMDGDEIKAEGGVEMQYRGYILTANRAVFNRTTEVAYLEGDARILGRGAAIRGDSVQINFTDETYSFLSGSAQFDEKWIQGRLTDDIFVAGESGEGTRSDMTLRGASFTTCDKDEPHYEFRFDEGNIRPGDRALLEDVRLRVMGRTLFTIPSLAIPLYEGAERYLPEVGQSPDEGYYAKFTVTTPLPGEDYLDHHIDLMQKLGVGIGTDWSYSYGEAAGVLSGYRLFGQDETTRIGLQHRQGIFGGDLSISGEYQDNNYLTAPGNTLINLRSQFVLPWGGGQTRLTAYRNSSERSGFSSVSESYGIADTRRFGPDTRTQLDLTLSRSESSGGISNVSSERLDINFVGSQRFQSVDAELLYRRAIPVGGTSQNFFNASDRTPMLNLKSDSRRLIGEDFGRRWPITVLGSVGELANPNDAGTITRFFLDLGVRRSEEITDDLTFDWTGQFEQGVYSDDTAQYTTNATGRLNWQFAERSAFNLNYRQLRSDGFTPLFIDRTGRTDAFNADVSYQATDDLRLYAQTGYDLVQAQRSSTPWQTGTLRAEYRRGQDLSADFAATYDSFRQTWSNMRLNANFRAFNTNFTLASRYDGLREQLAGASIIMQGFKWGKTTLNALVDYNGYTNSINALHATLVYDLHCTEAVLEIIDNRIGFRSGRQIGLFLRIKAFPSASPFGIGRRGQQIGGFGFGG